MKDEVLSAPIRWAGSKKKILNEMLESFKKNKDNYIEPFLGSGVVMINVLNNNETLCYKNVYVNDINSHIIKFYKLLQLKPKLLINALLELSELYNSKSSEEQEKLYYEIREKFNSSEENTCVYFYFLMKVGFNGVYRENREGKFNVPFGRKKKIIIPEAQLYNVSRLIKPVKFYNLSYEKFLERLLKDGVLDNSFIYCDPPYIPEDQLVNQKQELYTNNNFNHYEFVDKISMLNSCDILISMSDSTLAQKIYGSIFMQKKLVDIIRTINPLKLFKSGEILFYNFSNDE